MNSMWTIKKNPDPIAYKEISTAIEDNAGYCCCALEKNADTVCMCKDFRNQDQYGFCHCGKYYKVKKHKVITLCGSTRFKDEFIEAQRQLTLDGHIVISVGLFGHSGDTITEEQKKELDELHKSKIEMSDAIYVINKNGYIGESTQSEIEWAEELGKEIIYMEEKEYDRI